MTAQPQKETFAPDVFESISEVVPVAPTGWLNTAWLENMTAVGNALASFVAERFKADVELQHDLLKCRSFAEVQHAQAAFVQKAFDQYQAETGKLIALTGKMALNTRQKASAGD